jgi:hypothetical protein
MVMTIVDGRLMNATRVTLVACALLLAGVALPRGAGLSDPRLQGAQEAPVDPRHAPLDQILDLQVRDGYVYYRALRQERARLDAYVGSLSAAPVESMSRTEQLAFWLNAYNALVLRTVIDHYPIERRSSEYPANSIRQIPGAFERMPHQVGRLSLTLDQIERTILPKFEDPRAYLALGRGAVGSGRLRSEAFTAVSLERQLSEAAGECAMSERCVRVDRLTNAVLVSSIFSWREREFSGVFAPRAERVFASRSPIERAVLAFMTPHLLRAERELLAKNQFSVRFVPFDWSLNDLAGR